MTDEMSVAQAAADEGTPGRTRSTLAGSMIAGRRRPEPAAKPAAAPAATAKPAAKPRRATAKPAAEGDERPTRARRPRATAAIAAPTAAAAPAETPPAAEVEAPIRRRRTSAAKPEATPVVAAAAPAPVTPAATATAVADAPRVVARRRRRTDEPPAETATVPAVAEPSTPAPVAIPSTPQPDSTGPEIARLRALVEAQRVTLAELKAGMLTLAQQVDKSGHRPRLAVFVDVPNLMYGVENGRTVHMGRLLDMLREGRELVRATAYCPISDDPREPVQQQKFVAPFVPYDYRIVTKPLKRFADGSIKGNFDVEMAIDMVHISERVDIIAIVSGDADFARAVESVQGEGVHVEVVAFQGSTSLEMRALADRYLQLDRHAEWLVS